MEMFLTIRVALLHSGIVTVITIAQNTLCAWQL